MTQFTIKKDNGVISTHETDGKIQEIQIREFDKLFVLTRYYENGYDLWHINCNKIEPPIEPTIKPNGHDFVGLFYTDKGNFVYIESKGGFGHYIQEDGTKLMLIKIDSNGYISPNEKLMTSQRGAEIFVPSRYRVEGMPSLWPTIRS